MRKFADGEIFVIFHKRETGKSAPFELWAIRRENTCEYFDVEGGIGIWRTADLARSSRHSSEGEAYRAAGFPSTAYRVLALEEALERNDLAAWERKILLEVI